jgi:site-specific DNA recombinase
MLLLSHVKNSNTPKHFLPKKGVSVHEDAEEVIRMGKHRAVLLFYRHNSPSMQASNLSKAALLCRVSTKDQEEGYSLEAQEKLLREYCVKNGFEVSFVWSFSETASKYEQRKKFKEFVKEVHRTHVCHIVAEKVDRISRSGSRDAVLIDEWVETDANRHVHLVKQSLDIHRHAPSTAKFVWGMHLAVAKHMSDNLSEEVQKATSVMLSRGIWPTKSPTGYIRVRDNLKSPIQKDPLKEGLVKKLFALYDQGDWSVQRLSDEMYALGLRNSNGNKIVTSRVHTMLQDVFYVGDMRFRGKIWPGIHEPIVSREVFDRIQRRLKRNLGGSGASAYQRHDHLMRGLCTCLACSFPLTWEIHRMKTYGNCKRKDKCSDRAMKSESNIETVSLEKLQRLIVVNKDLADWIYGAIQVVEKRQTNKTLSTSQDIDNRIQDLNRKLDRLVDLRIEGELTKEVYEQKRESLEFEIHKLKGRRQTQVELTREFYVAPSQVFRQAQTFYEDYIASEPPRRRDILKQVFKDIQVSRSEIKPLFRPRYQKLFEAVEATNCSKLPRNFDFSTKDFERIKIGSHKQKSQPLTVGNPVWLAVWGEYLREPE